MALGAKRAPKTGDKAKNKPEELRAKTADELGTLLVDLRREQFNLRFQRATGQNEGIGRVRTVRRDIARVKTIMAAQKSAAPAKQG